MNESDKQYKSIFELIEGKEVQEPVIQLKDGTVVKLLSALKDIYYGIEEENIKQVQMDVDLLATLILSDENDIAKDRLITWQANILTKQLEKEIQDAI